MGHSGIFPERSFIPRTGFSLKIECLGWPINSNQKDYYRCRTLLCLWSILTSWIHNSTRREKSCSILFLGIWGTFGDLCMVGPQYGLVQHLYWTEMTEWVPGNLRNQKGVFGELQLNYTEESKWVQLLTFCKPHEHMNWFLPRNT